MARHQSAGAEGNYIAKSGSSLFEMRRSAKLFHPDVVCFSDRLLNTSTSPITATKATGRRLSRKKFRLVDRRIF